MREHSDEQARHGIPLSGMRSERVLVARRLAIGVCAVALLVSCSGDINISTPPAPSPPAPTPPPPTLPLPPRVAQKTGAT